MKNQFRGYIPYTEEDYKNIWKNSIIIIDTNVILNFYRYSDQTRNTMWTILEHLKNRIWMPYQVGVEYVKNRKNVIDKVEESLTKIEAEINKQLDIAKGKLQEVDKKDIKCKEQIIKLIDGTNSKISNLINTEKKQQNSFAKNDIVLNKILKLFENRCGKKETEEKLEIIKKEAKRREENKIPPGYKDRKKGENYGDYYIFQSMIEKAKEEKKDIIFITDDEKEDWYLKQNGINLGGRPELLQEFYEKTEQLLLICTTNSFVKGYSTYYNGREAPNSVMREMEEVRKKENDERNNIFVDLRNLKKLNETPKNLEEAEKQELFSMLYEMKNCLVHIKYNYKDKEKDIQLFEQYASKIMQDMRFESIHSKFLSMIYEFERNINNPEELHRCEILLKGVMRKIFF